MKKLKTILNIKLILVFVVFNFISCSKDGDDPSPPEVTVTVSTANFSTTMDENPTNRQVIGNVQGSTNQGAVTFSVTEQTPAGAFAIDAASGELKVADATLFDFETNPTITGTVNVANGAVSKNAFITITLNDVIEPRVFDGNVDLQTQAEVDEFGRHNYIGITGYLVIGYKIGTVFSNITDLSPLQALTFVGKNVNIENNPDLQSLIGFENLSDIGDSLNVYANSNLSNIESLSKLVEIKGSLSFANNPSITNLNGIHNILKVEYFLGFKGLSITNLNGIQSIRSVGTLLIESNPNLENIEAISEINTIKNGLYIRDNPSLGNLDPLINFNGTISVVYIRGNNLLTNLDGLQNIRVRTGLRISDNISLTNLSGLGKITNITEINIERNENLLSLDGLENIEEISLAFRIKENPNLSDFCAITNLCVNGDLNAFQAVGNAYNPTKQDIIDGNCSL